MRSPEFAGFQMGKVTALSVSDDLSCVFFKYLFQCVCVCVFGYIYVQHMRHHIHGAENLAWILCRNNKTSYPLTCLSSPVPAS